MSGITNTNLRRCQPGPAVDRVPAVGGQEIADESPISRPEPDQRVVDEATGILECDRSADTEQLRDIVTTVADEITPVISDAPASLRGQIESWCVLHGFDDVSEDTASRLLARQAAFYYLLKATLYEWYHRHRNLPELTAGQREGFRTAAEAIANPVFGECVLDEVIQLADEAEIQTLIEQRDELLASTQPAEDIGRIYEAVLPKAHRQILGQFRTPPEIAKMMRSWAANGTDCVLDPGLGAGVLSSPYHPRWCLSTDPAHVNGIDRSPLSLLMGSTALTLYGQTHIPLGTDFLSIGPDDLEQDVDAIVCNPPYTKADSLPTEYNDRIRTRLETTTGIEISGRSPLYTYFMYHSRSFLDAGDRAVFITPQSFLSNRYGESLKQFLREEYAIKAIVQFHPGPDSVFDTADTTALLTFLEAKTGAEATNETRFVRVDETVQPGTVREAVRDGAQGATDWGFINCVAQAALRPEKNWQVLFDPVEIDTGHLPALGEFLTIHRGPVTGNVNLFCLSQSEVDEAGLDKQHLSRIVRKPSQIQGYDYQESDWEEARASGNEVWLFDPDCLPGVPDTITEFKQQITVDAGTETDESAAAENGYVAAREYLQEGVVEYDLSDTSTFTSRPYWYRPRRTEPTRVLVQNASRDGFRFVLNETDIRNTNACYGFYDIELSEIELKALLAYLNSSIFEEIVREHKQTREGGFDKIEPKNLEEAPVIDPTGLPDDVIATLAECFDELCEEFGEHRTSTVLEDNLNSMVTDLFDNREQFR